MSVGFVMLVHTALDRAAAVARHWARQDCPVVIHVDRQVSRAEARAFTAALSDLDNIRFCRRRHCEWGTWSIVAATLSGTEMALAEFPELSHVFLVSGSCLPLRPVSELRAYLAERPRTDFIESVIADEVDWTVGGLGRERFSLRFPFAWKRQRRLFDGYVRLQRRLGVRRRVPKGIEPHLGSQWWCLTRQTLSAILADPQREDYTRYFRRVWIPDESYFQTLVRKYATRIESRSLTLSKFDFQGKPHIFYDDHLQLLRRSDCFVARKVWPQANRLYDAFLGTEAGGPNRAEPNPARIDRLFSKAVERRTRGRAGLYMQSRFPREGWENGRTSAPYSVFEGFSDLFEDFEDWLGRTVGARVHGHLFHPDRAEIAGGEPVCNGGLSDSASLRDYNARAFLTNLVWNTRGERQCFQFGPGDRQEISWFMATDPNAQISVITGAWAVPLFHSRRGFVDLRKRAAQLQRTESHHLEILRSPHTRARVRIWTMADFVQNPMEPLQILIDEIAPRAQPRLTEVPRMADLTGFGQFLQTLKNQGMKPYLMGDFPAGDEMPAAHPRPRRPYLVQ
ncbi:beta-1,6-N-acetylglucosaminyltransferase [Rhodovulum euryhalinum]|uniref:Peptide O-xylosyltransferase n=1 Tax=Rhodovulum euryhalinum TaxID=35805 RepID=A0A4V2SA13_9RHOB|nr:beta-1,6-N-acetylglucosaminyltransferase [Rhodovulum euryhalinum]TCO69940.1 core-2/I-Branching enzyme [Rhodovulum euryhalinum]